jgi:hypothetical protein
MVRRIYMRPIFFGEKGLYYGYKALQLGAKIALLGAIEQE